jgi:hypothetical protein
MGPHVLKTLILELFLVWGGITKRKKMTNMLTFEKHVLRFLDPSAISFDHSAAGQLRAIHSQFAA